MPKKFLLQFIYYFIVLCLVPSATIVYAHGRMDAMMAYEAEDSGGTTYAVPRFRLWGGSSWGSESAANPVAGTIRHMALKYAPTRDEAILVALTSTGEVQAQVFNGSDWGTVTTLGTITDGGGNPATQSLYKGFDLAYEQSSGDALVIYGDGTADPDYQIWNGSNWSGGSNIDVPSTGIPNWIVLASRPGSDNIAMLLVDSSSNIYGMRWSGSAWDDMGTASVWGSANSSIATKKSIDVAYEQTSGDIMFLWGTSVTADDHRYRTYVGTTLGAVTALPSPNAGGQPHWIRLASNPTASSNQIMLGSLDAGADLNTFLWSGSSWSASHAEHDATTEDILDMNFDIEFETHTSNANDAWLVWGDGATISRKLWNVSSWAGATTSNDDTAGVLLTAQPNSGAVLGLVYEDPSSATDDVLSITQTGGVQTWNASTTLWEGPTTSRSGNFYYALAAQRYSSSTEAMVVYDTLTTASTPRYRLWTGSWGSQLSANRVDGPIMHLAIRFSPVKKEAILVTQSFNGVIQAQIWNGSTWGTPQVLGRVKDASDISTTQSSYRGFDLDYEGSSGDAIIVYGDGTADPNYRVWNGSSWGSENNIDIPTAGIPNWIEISASSVSSSDELAMILVDSNVDIFGLRWTGATWDAMGEVAAWDTAASTATKKSVDVEFEKASGEILYIWGDDTAATHWNYRTYSSSTLGGVTALTNTNQAGVGEWVVAKANPFSGSNQIMIGGQDAGNDLNTRLWGGTGWDTAPEEHTATCENTAGLCFDITFETLSANANDAWVMFGNGSSVSKRKWNDGAWETETTSGDDTINVDLETLPISGAILGLIYEDQASQSDDILETNLTNGSSTWSTDATIWSGPIRAADGLNLIAVAAEQYYVNFTQNDFEFFVDDTTLSLSNVWPPGGGDNISENAVLTQLPFLNMALVPADKVRIQMNLGVSLRDLLVGTSAFKLQYSAAEDCTSAASWTDVGAVGSGAIWRLYDNTSLAASATQANQISTSTSGAEGLYTETNPSLTNPLAVDKDTSQITEFDWPVENNGATENTAYCFRMIESGDFVLTTYNADSYPKIITAPGNADSLRHGNFFQNEGEKGFYWAN